MARGENPRVIRALLEIIQNQLQADDPAEVRLTLERLLKRGISRKRALRMIACCLLSEMNDTLKVKERYNEARYVGFLRALPEMPWETDPSA
jgi:hypothetical protein